MLGGMDYCRKSGQEDLLVLERRLYMQEIIAKFESL